MELTLAKDRLVVVVGAGGVGKTTLAAALGLASAHGGRDTLVMTFDPSLRLKDALGVGEQARGGPVRVDADTPGQLSASLLDAKQTFDRLVQRYAPDAEAAERILNNRFYEHLAGNLSGILEYMAVERLFEVAGDDSYGQVILDTPPTRQALDFLEAPERIVSFLDSGAIQLALRPWFDDGGRLRPTSWLPGVGRGVEALLDRVVGMGLLRDMAEFFRAFAPLFEGFRGRALQVQALLRAPETVFVLVSGPGPERIADTMFFARKLREAGHRLGPILVNRVHPLLPPAAAGDGDPALEAARSLPRWLGERDRRGLVQLRSLLPGAPLRSVELLPEAPADLAALGRLGLDLLRPDSYKP